MMWHCACIWSAASKFSVCSSAASTCTAYSKIKLYQSSTLETGCYKELKEYFTFFILRVITVFKKKELKYSNLRVSLLLNCSNYLPTKPFKLNGTFTDSPP